MAEPQSPVKSEAGKEPAVRDERGAIGWMANNSVAANLAMFVVCIAGLAALFAALKQEVFPEFELDMVNVVVPYPGASPREVEQGVLLAVEEGVRGLDGVKRVTSVAYEGAGRVDIELLLSADADNVLSDVKSAVDRITTFPAEAEEPTIAIAAPRRAVISLVFSGDMPLQTLHEFAEQARAGLLAKDGVTQVDVTGVRPLEISIEVPRENLEAYGLSLDQIAAQIRASSIELPAGGLDTKAGQLLVRVSDRRLKGRAFEDLTLRGNAAHEVRLGDIARITDGYADTDESSQFNGQSAVRVIAYRVGGETPIGVSKTVRAYAEEIRRDLPEAVSVSTWADDSELLAGRIDLLVRNAMTGGLLVLVVLALFLRRRLAFWVALGIPISFLGAFALMVPFGVSINMVSLFALIVTLGMVVDDAIIVAENVHTKRQEGMPPLEAAIAGAREMAVPVIFSILTTVAAFSPLLFVPGVMGKIMGVIPTVVIAVLLLSLFESFLILPAHLGHEKRRNHPPKRLGERIAAFSDWVFYPIDRAQQRIAVWTQQFTQGPYQRFLNACLRWRYVVVATGVMTMMVVVAAVKTGVVPFRFFPKLEGDIVTASARLPFGTPVEQTEQVAALLQRAGQQALEDSGGRDYARGMFSQVGKGPRGRGPTASSAASGSHLVVIEFGLVPSAERSFSSKQFAERWRSHVPVIPGLESLIISGASGPGAGAAVEVQLGHRDTKVLAQASRDLEQRLRGYAALTDVDNSFTGGKPQLDFSLNRQAHALGLTSMDVARTLRSSFFGAEALREQRGRNELKVMVRLPEEQRSSEFDIDKVVVGTGAGSFVPLSQVADFVRSTSPTEITREEGIRTVSVAGELAKGVKSPRGVLDSLSAEVIPELKQRYPGLSAEFVGSQRSRAESFGALGPLGGIAMFVIFALLAIPFRSYIQPLIVMIAIPFGIVGAVLGHMVMGYSLSFISVLGIVALSGVVVNDSLVLVDAINRMRAVGGDAYTAVVQGAMRRLRPIVLTSVTTFLGLMPMIFETSPQAQFLIPMAISLGFGVLFVTLIVLVLVPSLYMIADDLRRPFASPTPALADAE